MSDALPAFQPLYAQVQHKLRARIADGGWKPGALLPSEFRLADEYRVSQGTVRKALLALEAERLIVRRQGSGTYVARHTSEAALFHFFRMVGPDDARLAPTSHVLRTATEPASAMVARLLGTPPGDALHAITRLRSLAGRPAIFERILVPVALMPDLAVPPGGPMAEEMYVIYQARFGITIARASERLAAVAASAEEAGHLGVATGAPLLEISRIASDVTGRAVELRISRCDTSRARYAAEVS
jgi:GntR family transcriptional regulator